MSALREAVILPAIFLTVALLGGLRVASGVRLVPPPLLALVLAMLLMGTLARGSVLLPAALLNAARRPIENLTGAAVVVALFAASAQAVNLVLPERGLLHAAFGVFLFVQLLTMNAAGTGRAGLLRSLLVLFGSLFILRFIVLESLYAEGAGALKRVLTALMAGVTLGGIEYQPHAAVTGYVAFFTLALYVIGLVLLPSHVTGEAMVASPASGKNLTRAMALVCAVALGAGACGRPEPDGDRRTGTVGEAKASEGPGPTPGSADAARAAARRDAALRSARVWRAPSVPVAAAVLGRNPAAADGFDDTQIVDCRFLVQTVGGTTPKFNCELPGGGPVRVKYGTVNPEIYAEVAATRLLETLGFGADRMYVIDRVRCAGCPSFPFQSLRCLAETGMERACFPGGLDYTRIVEFHPAVIERRLPGKKIEAVPDQGWAWYELDLIDPARGGSPLAEVDALRLVAVLLAHWDNKAENQRLVCLPGGETPDGGCSRPFALLQDLGATFGPNKIDLRNWRATPVWADARACRVSMKSLPFGGGTFPDRQISEAGRLFLLRLVGALSSAQLRDLFVHARVTTHDGVTAEGRRAEAWVEAFEDKVKQIRDAGPCPSAS